MDCAELHHLLAEARGQRRKDLVGVQALLGKVEARVTKAEKALGEAEARGTKVDMRIASIEVKVAEAEMRA